MRKIFGFGVLGLLFCQIVWALPTKIGNGDDGTDLENLSELNEGPLLESKSAAVELVKKLNTAGIPGLGNLLPEIENSKLFLAEKDVRATHTNDLKPDHLSNDGMIYARTLAEPYAPTRFFPAATKLSQNQMIKLHIHEALHRALPEEIREDEGIVSQLTLAITDPNASHDQIKNVAAKLIPEKKIQPEKITVRELYPSQVGYQFRSMLNTSTANNFEVKRAHIIQSYLYPFGSGDNALGLGLEFALLEREGEVVTGPLGLSLRWKAFSNRSFEIDLIGEANFNMLSSEELKNSPFGRDIYSLGVSLRKDLNNFYIENTVVVSSGGDSKQKIGNTDYNYSYGYVIKPSLHVGMIFGGFHLGAYADIFLADHFKVEGGAFSYDTGRYRLIAMGPEFEYRFDNLILGIAGRFQVNSTKGTNFNNVGNVLGSWVGKGGIQASVAYKF